MPITDIKAFDEKFGQSGLKDADLAKREGLLEADVAEAREFLRVNQGIAWQYKIQMWAQFLYSKQHPYVAPPPAPGAVPTVFGPSSVAQRTMAMQSETEFWKRMEDLIDSRINAAVKKILDA